MPFSPGSVSRPSSNGTSGRRFLRLNAKSVGEPSLWIPASLRGQVALTINGADRDSNAACGLSEIVRCTDRLCRLSARQSKVAAALFPTAAGRRFGVGRHAEWDSDPEAMG